MNIGRAALRNGRPRARALAAKLPRHEQRQPKEHAAEQAQVEGHHEDVVEPEPEVYARLAALAAYTRDGLEKKNLLDALFTERLMNFERLMLDLTAIACAELENRTLSDHDYALICNFGSTIEEMTTVDCSPGFVVTVRSSLAPSCFRNRIL